MSDHEIEHSIESDIDYQDEIDFPKNYRVLLHNDDYTTMEFVIYILQSVFGKNVDQATQIMLNVHNQGVGECGIFSLEIAKTKQTKVTRLAKENNHPLKCTLEEA